MTARHHELPATPGNMVWGYLDPETKPALHVDSGDTVTLACVPAGGPSSLPADRSLVPAEYLAAMEALPQGPGAHFVTGPVFVRGAAPGDTLQVDILSAVPTMDWGFVAIMPLLGTLPDEFTEYETIHPRIDRGRGVCLLPWGTELPLDPFFGVIGTAPPPEWGRLTTNVPRAFGGNMDNKELKPGTTLYLPVFNRARCSTPATATGCRATARCASPRWRLGCRAPSGSRCARTSASSGPSPRPRPT